GERIYARPCQITFAPARDAPAPAELPALTRGAVTFGCFNRFGKVSPQLMALWARVLAAVPGARLILKDGALDDPAQQAFAREALAAHGIGPERIELRGGTPRLEHLAALGDVDIALDPFPQNGGISSWEALWQGAPALGTPGLTAPRRLPGRIRPPV